MPIKQRENSGILFKNDRKESDTHPDYTGTLVAAGVEYFLNAWIKQGAKAKFMSLSIKPKDASRSATSQKPSSRNDFHDDPIPF
jgi:hypothetical protein